MPIPTLASRVIAEESRGGRSAGLRHGAAFRVCEKLGHPLSTYAGAAGFRSLLNRALCLARAEDPWLNQLQITADGRIQYSAEAHAQLGIDVAAKAGAVLVAELLGLLATFIGEALTLRLVQEIWPKAAFRESKPGGK